MPNRLDHQRSGVDHPGMFRGRFEVALSALLCVGLSFASVGCSNRTVSIKDVTKPEVLVLKKKPSQGAIHRLDLSASADLVGEARIQLLAPDGTIYKDEAIKGRSQFRWAGDWYTDEAEVRYLPTSASKGSVILRYEFAD